MLKLMLKITGVALLVAAMFYLFSCGVKCPGCDHSPCICEDVEVAQTQEILTQPEEVNVILDQSASMAGYFNREDMRSILQTINTLQQKGKKTGTVSFLGGKPLDNIAGGVLSTKNFTADTDMDKIFKKLVEMGDSIPVAFVTDGIVSTSHGLNDIPQMEANIEKTLKSRNKDLAYGVYQLLAPFDGQYWIEATRGTGKPYRSVNLKTSNRPYYVVVVGPKDKIRWIMNNVNLEKAKKIFFNVFDAHENMKIYPTDKDTFTGPKDGYYFLVNTKKDEAELAFKFPNSLASVMKSKPQVTINNEKLDGIIKGGISVDGETAYFEVDVNNLDMEASDYRNMLVLTYNTTDDLDYWTECSTTDDSKIADNEKEQMKTYGLEYLIKAMVAAQQNTTAKATFKFKK